MTDRLLCLNDDQAQALALGATFVARLAAVEHAHMLGDTEELDTLLSGIDPIEARHVANILQALYRVWGCLPEYRGGTIGVSPTSGSPSLSSPGASAPDEPPAPIYIDRYSRRA